MPEGWTNTFWVDSDWNYSEDARERIASHIDEAYIEAITRQVRVYLSLRENERDKPKRAQTKKQLGRLQHECARFLKALQVDEPAVNELTDLDPEADDVLYQLERHATQLHTLALVAERDYDAAHGKREQARSYLLHRLCDIWTYAHGEEPRRHRTGKYETSPFAHFVRECVSDLPGFPKGLDDLIAEVVDARKN